MIIRPDSVPAQIHPLRALPSPQPSAGGKEGKIFWNRKTAAKMSLLQLSALTLSQQEQL
jgi:hypothetical protein